MIGPEPTILHVDMDAFYAAVEVLDDPTLAGKAVIVGGTGDRGVVASCSYEARQFGIRSAMPSTRARRLCPHAVFVPGHFDRYGEYSRRIHEVFRSFTPLVEGIALDEAFLDVAGARRLFGPAVDIAHAIRARVRDEVGLSCSVGVASTKFVAKLASEAAKPKATPRAIEPGLGVKVVEPGGELAFLHPLPVQALWGVGPATLERLARFGVRTVGDLAALPESTLTTALGKSLGAHLFALAWGRDDRRVEPDRATKSVSHEETYAHDHHELEPLRREAVRMADAVATRLRAHGLAGRTVNLKVRFHDFRTITRSRTLPEPVDRGTVIARVASELLATIDPTAGVRLLGVGVGNLTDAPAHQLSLDDLAAETADGWFDADRAVDQIRRRFGDDAVGPATLVTGDGLRLKRRGDQQWGPGEDREREGS